MREIFRQVEAEVASNSRIKIHHTLEPLVGPSLCSPYTAKPYEKEFVSLDMADAVTLYNSLALRKDSEFTALFNYVLLKMQGCNSIDI